MITSSLRSVRYPQFSKPKAQPSVNSFKYRAFLTPIPRNILPFTQFRRSFTTDDKNNTYVEDGPIPMLPSSGGSHVRELKVGESISFEELGPIVIRDDGSMGRIDGWWELTDIERENIMKVIPARNEARRKKLLEEEQQQQLQQQQTTNEECTNNTTTNNQTNNNNNSNCYSGNDSSSVSPQKNNNYEYMQSVNTATHVDDDGDK